MEMAFLNKADAQEQIEKTREWWTHNTDAIITAQVREKGVVAQVWQLIKC
jgi:hypothetical protein